MIYGINIRTIITSIAIIVVIGFGVAAVLTYRSAILEAERLESENQSLNNLVNRQKNNILKLKKYQFELENLKLKHSTKVKDIMSKESKRDANGNIASDDPILLDLNGMFSQEDRNIKIGFANNTSLH